VCENSKVERNLKFRPQVFKFEVEIFILRFRHIRRSSVPGIHIVYSFALTILNAWPVRVYRRVHVYIISSLLGEPISYNIYFGNCSRNVLPRVNTMFFPPPRNDGTRYSIFFVP